MEDRNQTSDPQKGGLGENEQGISSIGEIYDDRFLVKPVRAAVNLMPNAEMEVPYEGAKGMLLVDDVDDREYLVKLFEAMYDELPKRKKK